MVGISSYGPGDSLVFIQDYGGEDWWCLAWISLNLIGGFAAGLGLGWVFGLGY